MAEALGIDLGTTMSAMAIVGEGDRPKIVPNREGKNITPSVVLFKEDECIIGERAKRAAVAQAENVARFIKRHMCDPDWIFLDERGKEHRPEEISALILKKLKEDAEIALGKPISKAVITVPAYFQDMERNRTRMAGEMAGFEVLRIINEPTAAAIAYGLDRLGEEMKVLVYDLGGGTFDVTIIEVKGTEINVLTSGGDRFLGGADFDELIVGYFQEQFNEKHGVDPLEDLRAYQDFMNRAEEAKHDLSVDTEVFIGLSAKGKVLDVTLTREQFNKMIKHLIDRTQDLTEQTLQDAKLSWADIDKVLLVGGSTRIPLVQEMVKEMSGKDPEIGINPDEVVAIGAAIVAAHEEGTIVRDKKGEIVSAIKIQDVTAHALGVIVWDEEKGREVNSIIIPKDTPIPAENTLMYTTVEDYQTDVRITVLEGEDEDPQYCTILGKKEGYMLSNIPPQPKGVPQIAITMKYDREAIVHVTARELESGQELNIEIRREELLTEEEKANLTDQIKQISVK